MAPRPIDPGRVRELYDCDPATGVLRWRKRRGAGMKPGDVAGGVKGSDPLFAYWVVRMDGRRYRRSRLVWAWVYGEDPPAEIDHIDRDKTNDRVSNLRAASRSQNGVNAVYPKAVHPDLPRGVRPKRKAGEVIGYRGRVNIHGQRVDLGQYTTPELAGAAVTRALQQAHGDEWVP